MTIALNTRSLDAEEWIEAFRREVPGETWELVPQVRRPEAVDVVLSMSGLHFPSLNLPNVKCVIALVHGVDSFLKNALIPEYIPIVRLDDEAVREQMTAHALATILSHHCRLNEYAEFQRAAKWQELPARLPSETRVGILGYGRLGSAVAAKLTDLGFATEGWSRTSKDDGKVRTYTGENGLREILRVSDILLNLLPATPQTHHLLDKKKLSAMKVGAYLINLGRGTTVITSDLIEVIDSGHLSGAYLDVVDPEPLPSDSPIWRHSRIKVTPHIAATARPESCVAQIVENVRRLRLGHPLKNVVDRRIGY